MAATNNKRVSPETTSPNGGSGKKLRQSTLSSLWSLGRGSSTSSPYFAPSSSRPPPRGRATSSGRARGRGRGSESGGKGRGKGRSEETDTQDGESSQEIPTSFESLPSFESTDDSFESGSFSFEESSQVSSRPLDSPPPPPPRQFFFPVPAGYRSIHRVNMASKNPIHYVTLQEIAYKNIHMNLKVIGTTAASIDSTLYIERDQYPTYAVDRSKTKCKNYKTKIEVRRADTLAVAIELTNVPNSDTVGVLNMANATRQGGGFLEGTTAQEEQLCYRTTLINTLKIQYYPLPDAWPRNYPGRPKLDDGTPLENEYSVVYSPAVAIYRDDQASEYNVYNTSVRGTEIISVLSVAALNLSKYKTFDRKSVVYPNNECREIMTEKIKLLLRVAVRRKKTRLVLGALGCGVFRNPPEEVAPIFRQLLHDEEFKGYFEHIVFAILPNGEDTRNFDVFAKEFS